MFINGAVQFYAYVKLIGKSAVRLVQRTCFRTRLYMQSASLCLPTGKQLPDWASLIIF